MNPSALQYPPSLEEIRAIGARVGSGAKIAQLLHLGAQGGRTWRRWISGEAPISFGNWFALNAYAEQFEFQQNTPPKTVSDK